MKCCPYISYFIIVDNLGIHGIETPENIVYIGIGWNAYISYGSHYIIIWSGI